jgi:hypothetical protein
VSRHGQLADDLRIVLIAKQAEIEAKTGDNGLDAVAWLPTGDRATTMVTVFAQCACGKEWRKKQQEAGEQEWSSVLAFRSPVVNMTLIPYSFRKPDGSWSTDYHVRKGVLLDRERILDALAEANVDYAPLVPAVVDEVVGHGAG